MSIKNHRHDFEIESHRFNHTEAMYRTSRGFERYWQNARRRLVEVTLRGLKAECTSVLDVGCAEGLYVEFARNVGYQAYGTDLSEGKLRRGEQLGPVSDAQYLPFADESFDVVVLSRILEYVPDDDRALAEARRVAKRYVVVTVPRGRVGSEHQYEWGVRCRFYDAMTMSMLLKRHGSLIDLRSVVALGHLPLLGRLFVRGGLYRLPGMADLDLACGRLGFTMQYAHELFAVLAIRPLVASR